MVESKREINLTPEKSRVMNPETIINEALVNEALDIAEPSIAQLFEEREPKTIWGPKYLVVVVRHPALETPIVRKIGVTDSWQDSWGLQPEELEKIAVRKAETAQREGKPTSELTLQYPWDHESGDYLYAGGVVSGKLAVGSSGLMGFADETASNIVLNTIEGLSKLKRQQLLEAGLNQLT